VSLRLRGMLREVLESEEEPGSQPEPARQLEDLSLSAAPTDGPWTVAPAITENGVVV
jgi:hypothetical protein